MRVWETNFALSCAIKELRTAWQAIEWAQATKEQPEPEEHAEIARRLQIIRGYTMMIEDLVPAAKETEAA